MPEDRESLATRLYWTLVAPVVGVVFWGLVLLVERWRSRHPKT